MTITKKLIKNKLLEVMDPELNISIIDLGLINDVKIDKNKVKIVMTLTTVGCPLAPMIEQEIKSKLSELKIKEKDISIELTFDPPWTTDKMSKKGKEMLGIN